MVCFDITLAYPLDLWYKGLVIQERRVEHLRKHFNADVLGSTSQDGIKYIRFAICDEDTVGLLRDIPHPVYCVSIKILRTNLYLYSFYKVTRLRIVPPRENKLLKDIYWSASQLERRLI